MLRISRRLIRITALLILALLAGFAAPAQAAWICPDGTPCSIAGERTASWEHGSRAAAPAAEPRGCCAGESAAPAIEHHSPDRESCCRLQVTDASPWAPRTASSPGIDLELPVALLPAGFAWTILSAGERLPHLEPIKLYRAPLLRPGGPARAPPHA